MKVQQYKPHSHSKLTIVIYEINADKARKKFADRLLDLGLTRTQYSVFLGTIDGSRVDEPRRTAITSSRSSAM